MSHHSQPGSIITGFLLGALASAALSNYLFTNPQGKQQRRRARIWLLRAQADIMEKMESTRDLTQDRYNAIIDEVLERYVEVKQVSKESAERVAELLKRNWRDMKRRVEEAREEAEEELKIDYEHPH